MPGKLTGGLVAVLVSLWLGCAVAHHDIALPLDRSVVREQLVVHSDFKLPERHRLLDELVAMRLDVAERLQLPTSDEPIHVYLFQNRPSYQGFIDDHYPNFPDRRAFFVETDTRLIVYAYWGDRVAEDLRHEVSHGYLHSVVPRLPLWLDEGLAEYFEVERGRGGLNTPHTKQLLELRRRNGWSPDLRRLESITQPSDMSQIDYAEAWAWVHWLLETSPANLDLLRNHVARIRMTGSAPRLSARLSMRPDVNGQLIGHLRRVNQ